MSVSIGMEVTEQQHQRQLQDLDRCYFELLAGGAVYGVSNDGECASVEGSVDDVRFVTDLLDVRKGDDTNFIRSQRQGIPVTSSVVPDPDTHDVALLLSESKSHTGVHDDGAVVSCDFSRPLPALDGQSDANLVMTMMMLTTPSAAVMPMSSSLSSSSMMMMMLPQQDAMAMPMPVVGAAPLPPALSFMDDDTPVGLSYGLGYDSELYGTLSPDTYVGTESPSSVTSVQGLQLRLYASDVCASPSSDRGAVCTDDDNHDMEEEEEEEEEEAADEDQEEATDRDGDGEWRAGRSAPTTPSRASGRRRSVSATPASVPRGKWTAEEDRRLREGVAAYPGNWKKIALMVGDRTAQQCLHRWRKSVQPGIRRSRWQPHEDAALRAAVAQFGTVWAKVRSLVPHRTDVQCRERWTNILDPALCKEPWSAQEDDTLCALVREIGLGKWSKIAERMPRRRTDYACRKRYEKLARRGLVPPVARR